MANATSNKNTTLRQGQYLRVGEYLTSPNGAFFATLLKSGHVGVYAGPSPAANRHNVWNSDRWGDDGNWVAMMQEDGNFAVYPGTSDVDRHGPPVWHAGVSQPIGSPYRYWLTLTDKGQLVIGVSTLQVQSLQVKPVPADRILWQSDRTEDPGSDLVRDQGITDELAIFANIGTIWQTFVPQWTGTLATLYLWLNTSAAGGSGHRPPSEPVTLSIFEGYPPEEWKVLDRRKITANLVDMGSWKPIQCVADFCHVTAGRTYTLQLEGNDPSSPYAPTCRVFSAAAYPAGRCSVKNRVLAFVTYVRPDRPDWPHPIG